MKMVKNKWIVILTVIVAIIVLLAGIGFIYSDFQPEVRGSVKIELKESTAVAGVPFDLHISTTEDDSIVVFPDNIMVAFDGIFRNKTIYNFTGNTATIKVLIPLGSSNMDIVVRSGDINETFKLTIENQDTPLVSGESFYDHEATLTRRFNNRNVGSPMLRRTAEFYNSYFTQLGYDSEIREYQKQDGIRTYDVLDVVAYKWGFELPKEWIILGGHYDIIQKSIEGAYDNGGGACAVIELAEGLATLKTSRTIVFALWDGEEKGLWGSNLFASDLPSDVDVKAYLNFDMVGLNWPLPYDLLVLTGPNENDDIEDCPELNKIANDAVTKYLGYPDEGIDIHEGTGGGSDHLSFNRVGVQSYFFYGNAPYIQYHRRTDLLVDMVAYAGGRDRLEEGFATVAWIAFYITLLLDNNDTLHQSEPPEQ